MAYQYPVSLNNIWQITVQLVWTIYGKSVPSYSGQYRADQYPVSLNNIEQISIQLVWTV